MHGLDLLVQVYNDISHSDSVSGSIILLLLQGGWMGQGQVVVATFRLYPENIGGCSLLLVVARELGIWSFPQVVA